MISDLKSYPEYKESGLPWLGAVPGHWSQERAKWLFTKMERPVGDEDDVVTCFRDGMVTLRKNRRLRGFTEAIYEFGYQGIRRGDLVIHAMDAFAGAVGVSDSDGKATPVYAVCQPEPGINVHYYAFIVREMARSQWILALSRGIRERSTDFRYDTFGGLRVPLPPPKEQAAIVRFLDWANRRLERAIRAKRKVIALLNEQKQAIIYRAVTRGLNPAVPLKPSGISWLGDIPQHWDFRAFARLARVVRGASPRPAGDKRFFDGDYIPWLTVGEVTKDKGTFLTRTETSLTKLGEERSVRFPAGTLVLTNSGATLGVPKILSVDVCANDGIVAFLKLDSVVDPVFAYYYLSTLTERLRDELRQGGTQPNLNTGIVRRISCPLPPKSEQLAILTFVESELSGVRTAVSRLEREIELLREYRTRLVADVVTGKLDVREVAALLPEQVAPETAEDDTDLSIDPEAADEEAVI
jgi:type I restriction enzyme S subunit